MTQNQLIFGPPDTDVFILLIDLVATHVLDVIRHDPKSVDIWSPDTDVFILLIDLVATHDNFSSKIYLLTKIDVSERIQIVGKERSKGLIGLHNFSGAD